MPLATLAQVKEKLQIPTADTIEDSALQKVLDAAEQFILNKTGFVLADADFEEIIRNFEIGRVYYLSHRPVQNLQVQVRIAGDPNWYSLNADVLDADLGSFVVPPGSFWPATPKAPPWLAWRNPTWDIAKATYRATALSPIPADLSDATAAIAAYWWRRHLAGPTKNISVGTASEAYSDLAVPDYVFEVIARYYRKEKAVLWV
jgi:hypothetical protein